MNEWKEKREKSRSSESVVHQYEAKQGEKVTGLSQKDEVKETDASMKEIFHMGNAFGDLALGMNERKEASLVFSRKKNDTHELAEDKQKEINGAQQKETGYKNGTYSMNELEADDTAFAVNPKKKELSERDLFLGARDYAKEHRNQELMFDFFTFTGVQGEQKELHKKEVQFRESLEKNALSKESLDEEKESFKQELFRKERQEQRIRREITEALAKEEKQGKKEERLWNLFEIMLEETDGDDTNIGETDGDENKEKNVEQIKSPSERNTEK